MLILLLITVSSLTLGTAEDKLIADRLSHEQMRDILDKVNKDLSFLQVVRDPDQCNYNQIMDEIQNSLEPNLFLHRSVSGRIESPDRFEEVVKLLERGDSSEAIGMSVKIAKALNNCEGCLWNEVWVKTAQSYLHYLIAEAQRKLGNHKSSLYHLMEATFVRQTAKGISVDELEKLNALIALQRVAKFNQDVNELGAGDSDDCYANEAADQMHPYHDVSTRISSQDFDGQCVASQVVNSILVQFEENLRILDLSSDRSDSVLVKELTSDQVERLEKLLTERSAQKLLDGTSSDAIELWQQFYSVNIDPKLFKSHPNSDEQRQRWTTDLIDYLKAEVYHRSNDCNRVLSSEVMLDRIKQSRRMRDGLPLNKLLQLEGRIVLKTLICLIRSTETIYQLDEQGDKQRWDSKRSILGGSESLLPQIVSKKFHQYLTELEGELN